MYMNTSERIIVILAGGSGTRLWPLSRKNSPKQFHALLGEQSLLQDTYDRCLTVTSAEHIFICTAAPYAEQITQDLPQVSADRIIFEPVARNTAPAIAYAVRAVQNVYPQAAIATISSDHAITNPAEFTHSLTIAFEALTEHPDSLITVGVTPTRPDTGFGYIQMGNEQAVIRDQRIFDIANFKEKPDEKTATEYFARWEYLWNAGYFIFLATSFHDWISLYAPEIAPIFTASEAELTDTYTHLASTPIDTALVEKLPREKRLVIPSTLEWSDVGNWATLLEELQKATGQKTITGSNHIDIKGHNILVKQASPKKFIGTIGLSDIIIVDTDDALLIAHKDSVATDIKELLEEMKHEKEHLL